MSELRRLPFRPGLLSRRGDLPNNWGGLVAAAVVVTVAVAAGGSAWRAEASMQSRLAEQQRTIGALEQRLAEEPNWPVIVALIEPSVATVEAGDELGSAWVAHSDARGSDLVTNYHVVADAWNDGTATVDVRQGDRILSGTVARVDPTDDLAVVHVSAQLPALFTLTAQPKKGSWVMAIGSPLGLDGTVTVGIVSAFRSVEGSEYMQFSAPISPGNSGGPVVDDHGRVVGIASAKFVYRGAEGLSLAIPVEVVCLALVTCTPSPSAGFAGTSP